MKTLISFLAFFYSVHTFSQNNNNYEQKLDEYFSALTEIKNFNGNVIVAKNGRKVLDKTYNISGESDSLKINHNSKFIIASVSKIFIRYGILKLLEQGKINLSDKIAKFIPDFPNGDKISIEQLMDHKSGLPREIKDYEKYDHLKLDKIIELAKRESLEFEPGTKTLYSNIGYFVLHYIIDKVSNNGYWDFMQHEIIKKYKLNHTGEFNNTQSISDFAYGFSTENGKIIPVSRNSINRFETGNYFSTIDDLYLFSQQLLTGKHIKKSLALKMFGEKGVLIQAGGRPGYRAYYYQNITSKITFIFVSNYTDIPFQEVTGDVINILDDRPYEVPKKIYKKAIALSPEVLKRYLGKFELEADKTQTFTVSLENEQLSITDSDGEKTKIYPESEFSFFDNPESKDSYNFINHDGKYNLVIISTGITLKTIKIE